MGPHTMSDSVRLAVSKAHKGRPKSAEQREKIRINALEREAKRRAEGWTMPREDVERRAALKRGVPRPPEMVAKMAASKTGAKRQYLPDGSFIMVKS